MSHTVEESSFGQRFERVMLSSNAGFWDWDVRNDEFYASPRLLEMEGFPSGTTFSGREDFLRRAPFHPEDLEKWQQAVKRLFASNGARVAMEIRAIVHGEVCWRALDGMCFRDACGKVVRWSGSSTDITERKRAEVLLAEDVLQKMEQERRRAQRLEAIGTLAGGIAHDFNNILGAILGYGEMALRATKKGTQLRRDVDAMISAGERGRALVDRILAFSRSGLGERVPVHVEAVVQEALDQIVANLPPKVVVVPRLHAGRAAMLGDSTQVHQVVTNLATNAVQAMPQGGVLHVDLEVARVETSQAASIGSLQPGAYLVLRVADTGIGIAESVLESMFDPFFTTKEVGVGTGLGLSLVHGIVTSVGGAIDVATELGKGSTFTVYLPRTGEAPEQIACRNHRLPRGEGQRVLVVDDEEPLVNLATRALQGLGYEPVGFTSSAAALAAFRADPERFDAMLTDERMPGLSGSALVREIRILRDSLPILLMSGYTPRSEIGVGADIILKKPLAARELAVSMARALRERVG